MSGHARFRRINLGQPRPRYSVEWPAPLEVEPIMTIAVADRAKGPAVYLVDDDPAVLNALQFALDVDGYDVAVYSSAAEFLQALDDLADGCLVVDYHLPDMTGLELTGIVRARGVKSPVILITSNREGNVLR